MLVSGRVSYLNHDQRGVSCVWCFKLPVVFIFGLPAISPLVLRGSSKVSRSRFLEKLLEIFRQKKRHFQMCRNTHLNFKLRTGHPCHIFPSHGHDAGSVAKIALSPCTQFLSSKTCWFERDLQRLQDSSDIYQTEVLQ